MRCRGRARRTSSIAESVELPILDPDTGMGKAIGKMIAQTSGTEPTPGTQVGFSLKMDPSEMSERDFGEPEVKHPNDKEPKTEIDCHGER